MNNLLRRKGDAVCDRLRKVAPDAIRKWRGERLLSGIALYDAVSAMQARLDALMSTPDFTNPLPPEDLPE